MDLFHWEIVRVKDRQRYRKRDTRGQKHSQLFILFVTYECAHGTRALDYTMLKRLACPKHSSLMGPFVNCKKLSFDITVPFSFYTLYSQSRLGLTRKACFSKTL
jgi:hypothetical protein